MTESDTHTGERPANERAVSAAHDPTPDDQDVVPNAAPPPDPLPATHLDLPVLPIGPQKLDPNWITANRIKHGISGGIISAMAIVYLFAQWLFGDVGFFWGLIVAILVLVLVGFMVFRAFFYPPLWYRAASYELTGTAIEIRTGVVFRSVMTVPRSRVQHTDVGQGPLMRRFGIASLVIHTAGTQHARVVLSGLAKKRAEQIRDHLIARVSETNHAAGAVQGKPEQTTPAARDSAVSGAAEGERAT